MNTDLIDVEPLLGQHDRGTILVGPLLRLSIYSKYRYFYNAGNGSKVYKSISLGFVEDKTNAQMERADFSVKLKCRIPEVLAVGRRPELTHAVYPRWPNEETAGFPAFAEPRAKPKPTNDGSCVCVVSGDQVAENISSTYASPLTLDRGQPSPALCPAQKLVPSSLLVSQLSEASVP